MTGQNWSNDGLPIYPGSGNEGRREIKRPSPMPKYPEKIKEWLDYADSINAYPSYRWLAKNIGCSVETVKKHLKEMGVTKN